MSDTSAFTDDKLFNRRAIEAAIRIGLVFLLVLWCFNIVKPFVLLALWGAIMAVAVYPLFVRLQALLGGRRKLAAALITFIALALLVTPSLKLSGSAVGNAQVLAGHIKEGTLRIPPPAETVQTWPVIGEQLHAAWNQASDNLSGTLSTHKKELTKVAKWILKAAAGAGAVLLQFIVSILIAGVLLVYARSGTDAVMRFATRLMGAQDGQKFTEMASATILSVAQGVLGVAVIQAVLAGIGMLVMGVPYAGIWTLLVLILAVLQLPTILIIGPVIVYVFTITSMVPAVIFTIWMLLVGVSDSFLKPLLLGRGLDVPMPVILLGAIGGMLMSGIIGLFVGAVVLAVGYELFMLWMNEGAEAVINEPVDT